MSNNVNGIMASAVGVLVMDSLMDRTVGEEKISLTLDSLFSL